LCARGVCESARAGAPPPRGPRPPPGPGCSAPGASQAQPGRRPHEHERGQAQSAGHAGTRTLFPHIPYTKAPHTETQKLCTLAALAPHKTRWRYIHVLCINTRAQREGLCPTMTRVSTEAEQGPTHMLIHTQDTHTHHRNYSHAPHVYSKQSGRGPQAGSATRPARKCRKRCTAAHGCAKTEQSEASSASVQPRPCRLRSPVSTAGRGHQGHPCGEGWHAPLETAGIYLLR